MLFNQVSFYDPYKKFPFTQVLFFIIDHQSHHIYHICVQTILTFVIDFVVGWTSDIGFQTIVILDIHFSWTNTWHNLKLKIITHIIIYMNIFKRQYGTQLLDIPFYTDRKILTSNIFFGLQSQKRFFTMNIKK